MTKSISIALILSLIFSFTANSQDAKKADEPKKFMFGLKAGANFSWYKPDSRNIMKAGLKPGFSYGLMGDFIFQQNYALSMEFLISTINGKVKFKDPLTYQNTVVASNIEYSYNVRYIQVPFSFKFRTKEIGYIKYFAQFGLAPGVRITSKATIDGTNLPWPEDDRTGIKVNEKIDESFEPNEFDDDISLLNLPLIVGGGIEYNLSGNTSLYSNIRFENGFTSVLKSRSTTAFSKNLSVSVGMFF